MLALATAFALALVPTALATHTTNEGLSTEGCGVTKGGWGASPSGHNPAALLEAWFDEVFPAGFSVGDLHFGSAQDVRDFLPNGGTQLEEQTVALYINIHFGDEGLLEGIVGPVVVESDDEEIDGLTGYEVLELALATLDDDPDAEWDALKTAIDKLNNEDFGCAEACPEMDMTALAQSDGSIDLAWTDVGADEYNIYRSADEGDFVFLASTTDTEYADESTAVGVTYAYVITIVVDERESDACARAEATAVPFFGGALLAGLAMVGSVGAYRTMRRKS